MLFKFVHSYTTVCEYRCSNNEQRWIDRRDSSSSQKGRRPNCSCPWAKRSPELRSNGRPQGHSMLKTEPEVHLSIMRGPWLQHSRGPEVTSWEPMPICPHAVQVVPHCCKEKGHSWRMRRKAWLLAMRCWDPIYSQRAIIQKSQA